MLKAGKELCDCGKIAIWCYMPGYSSGENSYHCDDCVPRGCSCNNYSTRAEDYSPPGDVDVVAFAPGPEDGPVKWLDDHTWTHVDEFGREYPCCEHMHEPDGFDKD